MKCPPVKDIVRAVENDEFPASLQDHVGECAACAGILTNLRDESEGLTISVGDLWVKERISCPHQDILLSHVNGGLSAEESEYIEFHVDVVECPHCQAVAAQLEDMKADRKAPARLKRAMDDSMRRSAVFLENLKGPRS